MNCPKCGGFCPQDRPSRSARCADENGRTAPVARPKVRPTPPQGDLVKAALEDREVRQATNPKPSAVRRGAQRSA